MHDFEDNICRVCKQVFCCIACREKHEVSKHQIFPDCDICVYGNTRFKKNYSNSLLIHIKNVHWPLHCVYCNRLFGSTNELLTHIKCPVGHPKPEQRKSPYTPVAVVVSKEDTFDYESPPIASISKEIYLKNPNMLSKLITSTPMQKCEEKQLLNNMPQLLTPVEYPSIEMSKQSIIKQMNQTNQSESLKRRVTFCETPIMASIEKQDSFERQNNMIKQELGNTPNSGYSNSSTSLFYSIKEENLPDKLDKKDSEKENTAFNSKETNVENVVEKIDNYSADSTVWISAVNMSHIENNILDENKIKVQSPSENSNKENIVPFVTPMTSKCEKRQMNKFLPSPIIKNEVNINYHLSVHFPSPSSEFSVSSAESQYQKMFATPENFPCSSKLETVQPDCSNIKNKSLDASFNLAQVQSKLWSSMSKFMKTVTMALHGKNSSKAKNSLLPTNTCIKRTYSDYDFYEGPAVKRYKLTDIKCRRSIRDLPIRNFSENLSQGCRIRNTKLYVDKATQTDFYNTID